MVNENLSTAKTKTTSFTLSSYDIEKEMCQPTWNITRMFFEAKRSYYSVMILSE